MARFRKLTPQQARVYKALRILGAFAVNPQDARTLRSLQRRGLVRYRTIDGVRHAVLRETKAQQAVKARLKRAVLWFGWPLSE